MNGAEQWPLHPPSPHAQYLTSQAHTRTRGSGTPGTQPGSSKPIVGALVRPEVCYQQEDTGFQVKGCGVSGAVGLKEGGDAVVKCVTFSSTLQKQDVGKTFKISNITRQLLELKSFQISP